jgi:hypothetical protein
MGAVVIPATIWRVRITGCILCEEIDLEVMVLGMLFEGGYLIRLKKYQKSHLLMLML